MTKKEAADFLGVSERAIERYTKSGKLHPAYLKRDIGGQIADYDRAELERVKRSMSVATPTPRQSDEATPRRSAALTKPEAMEAFARYIGQRSPDVPLSQRLMLTVAEASAYSGIGVTFLEEAIATGKLKAHRIGHRAAWVVKREALEAWIKKL